MEAPVTTTFQAVLTDPHKGQSLSEAISQRTEWTKIFAAGRLFSRPLLMQSVLSHSTAAISLSSNTVSSTSYTASL